MPRPAGCRHIRRDRKMRIPMSLAFVLAVFPVLAQEAAKPDPTAEISPVPSDNHESTERPCIAHFKQSGNIHSGWRYVSWQEGSGVEYDVAFRRAAQAIARVGWPNVNSSKDTGTISARAASGSINVVVSEAGKGTIRVEANLTVMPTVENAIGYTKAKAQSAMCRGVEAPWKQ